MKLSRASSYALHALEYLAARGQDAKATSHHVAEARGIPEGFLLKVLKPLVSAGVLRSLKGPNGGYRLARPAAKITLLEVVEAVGGPIRGEVPMWKGPGHDGDGLDVRLADVCGQVAALVRNRLGKVRLSDLVGK
jgi:Rrf2 family protein